MGDGGRRYTEDEFALILRKAAALQDRSGVSMPREGGLSLAEISAIAGEVGIEPDLVARAAAEVDAGRAGGVTRLLGGSARHRLEISVAGTLPHGSHPRVIDAIRSATGHHGDARESLGSLEWHGTDGITHLFVTVTPGPRDTRVLITADRSSGQALTWLLSTLASLLAVGITGAIAEPTTAVGGLGLGAGILGAGLLTARTLWSAATRRAQLRLEGMLERIGREIGSREEADGARRAAPSPPQPS